MRILAIDPGIKTGFCLWDNGKISTKKFAYNDKLVGVNDSFDKIDVLLIEWVWDSSRMKNQKIIMSLSKKIFNYFFDVIKKNPDVKIYWVRPNETIPILRQKVYLSGARIKREEKKQATLKVAKQILGKEVSEDEADALLLLLVFLKQEKNIEWRYKNGNQSGKKPTTTRTTKTTK